MNIKETLETAAQKINEFLTPKMEGYVYVHFKLDTTLNRYFLRKIYYVVQGGVAYEIRQNNELTASGIDISAIKNTCKKLNKYSPTGVYESMNKFLSYEEVTNIFAHKYTNK